MITGIRAIPVMAEPRQRVTGMVDPCPATTTLPVVQPGPPLSAASDTKLMLEQTTTETSAVAAAKTARDAYIRASIAAGITPLPLP